MKGVLLILALVVALGVTPVARADDYAASLQALHHRTVGYTFGDQTVRTLRYVTVRRSAKNELLSRTTATNLGIVFRRDTVDKKANVTYSTGFTGNVFWFSNENGFTVQAKGMSAQQSFSEQLIESDAIATLPWTYLRGDRVDGKDVVVVRAEPKNTFPIDLYIDPTTGLYRYIVVDPKGDYEGAVHILAYTDVAGKKFVSKVRYEDDDSSFERSEFALNPLLADSDLHPPERSAEWEYLNAAPFPVAIAHDRIQVKATVNGVEGLFILDSGAQNILLSGKFARRAGLKAEGHAAVIGPSIEEKVDSARLKTLEIGGNTLRNVAVYFGTEELDEWAPDGLLGFDVFANAVVTFDGTHRTLQIQDPSTVDVDGLPGIHASIDLGDGSPGVPMKIKDSITLNALLDTGTPREMLIPWQLPTKYGLRMRGGNECGRLDDLTLGPIVMDSPAACLGGIGGRTALVGLTFFTTFDRVTFAYPSAQMVFLPVKR